jgi:hypothetical protein
MNGRAWLASMLDFTRARSASPNIASRPGIATMARKAYEQRYEETLRRKAIEAERSLPAAGGAR